MEVRPLDSWEGEEDEVRTHGAWERMISRCEYYDDNLYNGYGARGILVCERWKSFDAFVEDMGLCPPGCSLERDDIDFGYEPLNCRWIPWRKQMDNTRRTRAWSDFWNRRFR